MQIFSTLKVDLPVLKFRFVWLISLYSIIITGIRCFWLQICWFQYFEYTDLILWISDYMSSFITKHACRHPLRLLLSFRQVIALRVSLSLLLPVVGLLVQEHLTIFLVMHLFSLIYLTHSLPKVANCEWVSNHGNWNTVYITDHWYRALIKWTLSPYPS